MSEQKMREALDQARLALEPYDDVKPRDWISDRQRISRAHALVVEALAQQPVAVELTDSEIFDAFTDGAGIFNKTIPLSEQELKGLRAVIAAHEAKKAGGAA